MPAPRGVVLIATREQRVCSLLRPLVEAEGFLARCTVTLDEAETALQTHEDGGVLVLDPSLYTSGPREDWALLFKSFPGVRLILLGEPTDDAARELAVAQEASIVSAPDDTSAVIQAVRDALSG